MMPIPHRPDAIEFQVRHRPANRTHPAQNLHHPPPLQPRPFLLCLSHKSLSSSWSHIDITIPPGRLAPCPHQKPVPSAEARKSSLGKSKYQRACTASGQPTPEKASTPCWTRTPLPRTRGPILRSMLDGLVESRPRSRRQVSTEVRLTRPQSMAAHDSLGTRRKLTFTSPAI